MVGYASRNHCNLENKYICTLCNLILCDPVQFNCGHRFCTSCVNFNDTNSIICQECKETSSTNTIFSDRGMKNDMQTLPIDCCACWWNGPFKSYQDHLAQNHPDRGIGENISHSWIPEQLLQISPLIEEYSRQVFSSNRFPIRLCNATYLWKISSITSQLNDTNISITSLPFYITQYGYKMCIRLCSNGVNSNQSTHLSVFLVLMRGDYDPILSWPFAFQVIFCLYDTTDEQNHIIRVTHSDPNADSCQRPYVEMNKPFGISRFLPTSSLQRNNSPFISDDAMFLKVMITSNPIPTTLLRDILNIDLALPMYVQEYLIERKINEYEFESTHYSSL